MTARKVRFHPAAATETSAAQEQEWYAERSLIAASAFASEVSLGVRRVAEAPERWSAQLDGTRQAVFPRFPFVLVYRLPTADVVEIVAVAHQRRRSEYWKQR